MRCLKASKILGTIYEGVVFVWNMIQMLLFGKLFEITNENGELH